MTNNALKILNIPNIPNIPCIPNIPNISNIPCIPMGHSLKQNNSSLKVNSNFICLNIKITNTNLIKKKRTIFEEIINKN